jgi:hypothetical protein
MPNGEIVPAFIRKTTGQSDRLNANKVIRAALDRGYWIDQIEEKKNKDQPDLPAARGKHLITDLINGYNQKRTNSTDNVDPYTQINYRAIMAAFREWCEVNGLRFTEQLSENTFETYVADLTKPFGQRTKGLQPITIGHHLTHLKGFGDYGVREGCFRYNVVDKVRPPKGKRILREGFTDEKMEEIYEAARKIKTNRPPKVTGFEVETFLMMMRRAAMSIVDASLLDDGAIVDRHLASKSLRAAPAYGDELQYFRTKTEEQENRVHVHQPLELDLLERLAEFRERGLHKHGEHSYYFTRNSIDKRAAPMRWRFYLTPIFAAVGIKGCPTHRFRHSFAKEMILKWVYEEQENGLIVAKQIPISTIALWMGHADENTTRKHYNATIQARDASGSDMMRAVHAQRKSTTA